MSSSPLKAPSPSPTAEASHPSPPEELSSSPFEAPTPSPTAAASSPSPTAEASSPSPPAVASGPIVVASSLTAVASSLTIVALSPTVVASSPTEVTSPSETSPRPFGATSPRPFGATSLRPFGATSPHPPFRPSAVVLKGASTCPFIRIERSTISDLPPMGVLYRFLASPLMPSSYQRRLFVDIGSTSMAASLSISGSRQISVSP